MHGPLGGGPYWEMSDLIFLTIGSTASDEILYKKRYFIKLSPIKIYSALLWWMISAAKSCQRPYGISLGNAGPMVCVTLCTVQILQCLTYSAMSTFNPCQ